ncbi:PhoH-like phosphate starvation-inducible [Bacillus phage vB_BcoS-136]|uniref:Phosphate starvation-inducible protein n=1 Tax=Bacillus phage vB_BcoS-136 TaxID=2419619 RepID=A0A3G3BVS8_9CAUD|nr:PhoH-like phosphate starvation-inducible [Bacillus phage vB_BcoS-136]AYP68240.1 phosphate starvation-inducible protein [Bacillus phage vB_BcoS-136]
MGAFKNLLTKLFRKKKKYDVNNIQGYLTDTNILLSNPEILEKYDNIFIPSNVLREVEHLELTRKQDKLLQWQIRRFKRLSKNTDKYVDLKDYRFTLRKDWDKGYTDNVLVQIALDKNLAMVTNDILLRNKCKLYGIVVIEPEVSDFIENKGYKEVYMTQQELSELYLNLDKNVFELITNEYIVINDDIDGELLDIMKWNGESLQSLQDSKGRLGGGFKTSQFGDFKPRDEQQIMAVDSIFNNQLTSLRGRAGSGKSLIALNTAWHLVERKGYKLVIFVNPVPSKDAQELGFYKGDKLEKLMQSSVGTMLKSKFGDEFAILEEIEKGNLDILPFVDLRGFDTGDKTVAWILEAQNLTKELMKLGLQRIGEGSKVIVDGDFHQQVDKDVYQHDNGMKRMSEVFRGTKLYGEVELQNVWRSELADIADKM